MKVSTLIELLQYMPQTQEVVCFGMDLSNVYTVLKVYTNITGSVTLETIRMEKQPPAHGIPTITKGGK